MCRGSIILIPLHFLDRLPSLPAKRIRRRKTPFLASQLLLQLSLVQELTQLLKTKHLAAYGQIRKLQRRQLHALGRLAAQRRNRHQQRRTLYDALELFPCRPLTLKWGMVSLKPLVSRLSLITHTPNETRSRCPQCPHCKCPSHIIDWVLQDSATEAPQCSIVLCIR